MIDSQCLVDSAPTRLLDEQLKKSDPVTMVFWLIVLVIYCGSTLVLAEALTLAGVALLRRQSASLATTSML